MEQVYRVPLALRLVAFVGLLFFLNREAPGTIQAILVLVGIYLVATNTDRAGALVGLVPRDLGFLARPAGGGVVGGAAPKTL